MAPHTRASCNTRPDRSKRKRHKHAGCTRLHPVASCNTARCMRALWPRSRRSILPGLDTTDSPRLIFFPRNPDEWLIPLWLLSRNSSTCDTFERVQALMKIVATLYATGVFLYGHYNVSSVFAFFRNTLWKRSKSSLDSDMNGLRN